jgi:hypothetical protein
MPGHRGPGPPHRDARRTHGRGAGHRRGLHVTPDAPTTVRASFCNQFHFFAGVGADAAKGWLDQHPGARVLPDAYGVERPLIEQIRSGTAETGCC